MFMPVAFMFLLVWLKTLATQWDSPSIAYYCGQTYPWNYAEDVTDFQKISECTVKPQVCEEKNYYQTQINIPNQVRG